MDPFLEFNLYFANPEDQEDFLGPFFFARSEQEGHQAAIRQAINSRFCYLAGANNKVVGVLRGREEILASLFVAKVFHRKGIGTRLVSHFEEV